ncbi:unnamed protein product [Pedinophyceae sp. YPF-701]|nr:unnamed protein product [Pedinophyceae sp. YPF-701]
MAAAQHTLNFLAQTRAAGLPEFAVNPAETTRSEASRAESSRTEPSIVDGKVPAVRFATTLGSTGMTPAQFGLTSDPLAPWAARLTRRGSARGRVMTESGGQVLLRGDALTAFSGRIGTMPPLSLPNYQKHLAADHEGFERDLKGPSVSTYIPEADLPRLNLTHEQVERLDQLLRAFVQGLSPDSMLMSLEAWLGLLKVVEGALGHKLYTDDMLTADDNAFTGVTVLEVLQRSWAALLAHVNARIGLEAGAVPTGGQRALNAVRAEIRKFLAQVDQVHAEISRTMPPMSRAEGRTSHAMSRAGSTKSRAGGADPEEVRKLQGVVRTLQGKLVAAEDSRARLEVQLRGAETELSDARTDIRSVMHSWERLEFLQDRQGQVASFNLYAGRVAELAHKLHATSDRLGRVSDRLAGVEAGNKDLEAALAETQGSLQKKTAEVMDLKSTLVACGERIDGHQKKAEEASKQFELVNEQMRKAEVATKQARELRDVAERELTETRQDNARLTSEVERKARRLEVLEREVRELKGINESLEFRIERMTAEHKETSEKLERLEGLMASMDGEAKGQMSGFQRAVERANAQVLRWKQRMDMIKHQVRMMLDVDVGPLHVAIGETAQGARSLLAKERKWAVSQIRKLGQIATTMVAERDAKIAQLHLDAERAAEASAKREGELKAKVRERDLRVKKLSGELLDKDKVIASLTKQLEETMSALAGEQRQLLEATAALAATREELAEAQKKLKKLEELQTYLATIQEENAKLKKDKAQVENKLKRALLNVDEGREEVARLKAHVKDFVEQVRGLEGEVAVRERRIEKLKGELADLSNECSQLTKEYAQEKQRGEYLDQEVEKLQQQIEELQNSSVHLLADKYRQLIERVVKVKRTVHKDAKQKALERVKSARRSRAVSLGGALKGKDDNEWGLMNEVSADALGIPDEPEMEVRRRTKSQPADKVAAPAAEGDADAAGAEGGELGQEASAGSVEPTEEELVRALEQADAEQRRKDAEAAAEAAAAAQRPLSAPEAAGPPAGTVTAKVEGEAEDDLPLPEKSKSAIDDPAGAFLSPPRRVPGAEAVEAPVAKGRKRRVSFTAVQSGSAIEGEEPRKFHVNAMMNLPDLDQLGDLGSADDIEELFTILDSLEPLMPEIDENGTYRMVLEERFGTWRIARGGVLTIQGITRNFPGVLIPPLPRNIEPREIAKAQTKQREPPEDFQRAALPHAVPPAAFRMRKPIPGMREWVERHLDRRVPLRVAQQGPEDADMSGLDDAAADIGTRQPRPPSFMGERTGTRSESGTPARQRKSPTRGKRASRRTAGGSPDHSLRGGTVKSGELSDPKGEPHGGSRHVASLPLGGPRPVLRTGEDTASPVLSRFANPEAARRGDATEQYTGIAFKRKTKKPGARKSPARK